MTGRDAAVIMLVDDSQDEREMWATYLRQEGYQPVLAATSEDALRAATTLPPALVVADLRLPGSMNGLELTHRLKQHPATKRVPVVMLTGTARPHDRILAVSAGVDAFLSKPCAPTDLLRAIRSLLGADSVRSANRD